MPVGEYHLKPLPPDTGIYAERLGVAGVEHRKAAAARFIRGKELRLELEPEPSNAYDKHALRVFGVWKGWLRRRRVLLGYVPRDVAKVVAEGRFLPEIQPRLIKTYLGGGGFFEIQFQR